MKRFILSVLAISFGLGMVIFSALSVGQKQVQGQANIDTLTPTPSLDSGASESAQTSPESQLASPQPTPPGEYFLPYPGLLPDHFLYPVKMVRDRIQLSLASQPEKKFELYLLYANKRIGAAKVLVFGNKQELGIDTAVKAQGYLSKALEAAQRVDQPDTWYELNQAAKIHQGIIEDMITHVGNDDISRLQTLRDNNQEILKTVGSQIEVEDQSNQETLEVETITPAEFGN